ncbi:MAG: RNA polymerase sigma factor (sigma-70 family) [Patiriisocius sp.]|jgi:RNA polymerase sigma factor (sigma-70 family)
MIEYASKRGLLLMHLIFKTKKITLFVEASVNIFTSSSGSSTMLNNFRGLLKSDLSDERKFVLAISNGDRQAFQHLYSTYSGLFYSIALRYSSSTHEAEDFVQEAFVQIHKKADTFSFKGSFEGWMKRILVNACLSGIRKKKMQFDDSDDENILDQEFENSYVIESMTAHDIIEAIKELPVGCRTVLNMNVMDGFDHREIGKQLGITESASRSQLTKARAKLKVLLKQKNLIEK